MLVHDYIPETRQTSQGNTTPPTEMAHFSFQGKVSCLRWDSNPRHCFSRPVLLPLSYQGSSLVVDQIRQYKARQVSLYALINRGNCGMFVLVPKIHTLYMCTCMCHCVNILHLDMCLYWKMYMYKSPHTVHCTCACTHVHVHVGLVETSRCDQAELTSSLPMPILSILSFKAPTAFLPSSPGYSCLPIHGHAFSPTLFLVLPHCVECFQCCTNMGALLWVLLPSVLFITLLRWCVAVQPWMVLNSAYYYITCTMYIVHVHVCTCSCTTGSLDSNLKIKSVPVLHVHTLFPCSLSVPLPFLANWSCMCLHIVHCT